MGNDETTGAVNRSALEGLVLEDLLIVLRNGPPDKAKQHFPTKVFLCLRQGKTRFSFKSFPLFETGQIPQGVA